jgi:hypothetical protein
MLYAQRQQPGVEPPEFERVGQSSFQFLHLPSVAHNASLADIKGLVDNNASAIFGNPANLAGVTNFDVALSQLNYVADITYANAAFAKGFGKWGVFGAHVANLDAGELIRTSNLYDATNDVTYRSGDIETFNAGDILAGLSYARTVTDRLSIGSSTSYFKETLDSTKVENMSFDFGLFFETGFRTLTLSMVARNFGSDKEFEGFTELYGLPQSVRMPLDFRLGLSYDLIEKQDDGQHHLVAYLEGVHPNDGPERVHTALDYTLMEVLALRCGYKFNYDEQGLTFGFGVNYNMGSVNGRIDYAYLDYGRLSTNHLFTVGFDLGE